MPEAKLYIAPFQGITTDVFMDVFTRFFSGGDKLFTAFFTSVYHDKKLIRKVHDLSVNKINNINVVPQILSKDADEIIRFGNICHNYGYDEINWNLGCPFKRVAMKRRGSGLLLYPDMINEILDKVFLKLPLKLSIKCRLGYSNPDEILKLIPVFNSFDIKEIIIHARTGIQLYKGNVNLPAFAEAAKKSKIPVCYNGDIFSENDFLKLKNLFPEIDTWMIGRGALINPFLLAEIKKTGIPDNKQQIVNRFVNELYYSYRKNSNNNLNSINKMKELWRYLSLSFDNNVKVFGLIKKTKTFDDYEDAVKRVFDEYHLKH